MNLSDFQPTRRLFLGACALGTASFAVRAAFADELTRTPPQTEGPFYPDRLPLDTDNDLVVINNAGTASAGKVTHLTGRVLDLKGNPVGGALVEIWQCDHNGVYLHSRDSSGKKAKQDRHFQGFGRFLTGTKGEYYFRTIEPVPYPGRTPHIHFKVKKGRRDLLTTQCYIKGHAGNARDGILRRITDPKQRGALLVDFKPIQESKSGELAANFNIVLGVTPVTE